VPTERLVRFHDGRKVRRICINLRIAEVKRRKERKS
jgi:hypothetical protein